MARRQTINGPTFTTVPDGAITNAKVSATADIAQTKLANGGLKQQTIADSGIESVTQLEWDGRRVLFVSGMTGNLDLRSTPTISATTKAPQNGDRLLVMNGSNDYNLTLNDNNDVSGCLLKFPYLPNTMGPGQGVEFVYDDVNYPGWWISVWATATAPASLLSRYDTTGDLPAASENQNRFALVGDNNFPAIYASDGSNWIPAGAFGDGIKGESSDFTTEARYSCYDVNASGGNVIVTLETISGGGGSPPFGREVTILASVSPGANTITINAAGGASIEGGSLTITAQYKSYTLRAVSSTLWVVVAST